MTVPILLQSLSHVDPRILAAVGGVVSSNFLCSSPLPQPPWVISRQPVYMSTRSPCAAMLAWLLSSLLLSYPSPSIALPLVRALALPFPSHSGWLLTTVFRWLLRRSLGASPPSTPSPISLGERPFVYEFILHFDIRSAGPSSTRSLV